MFAKGQSDAGSVGRVVVESVQFAAQNKSLNEFNLIIYIKSREKHQKTLST